MFQHPDLNIIKFDSIAELGRYALKDGHEHPHVKKAREIDDLGWFGGLTMAKAAQLSIDGDAGNVSAAEALMQQYGTEVYTSTMFDMPSIAGGYCCVPEALCGEPESMREAQEIQSEAAPLHILVGVSAQSNVTPEQMTARGIAVLALVLKLSATRPITLDLITSLAGEKNKRQAANGDNFSLITARVNTTPLDIASAAFALTNPGFARSLLFSVANKHHGFQHERAKFKGARNDSHDNPFNHKRILDYLDIDGESFYIPGAMSNSPVIKNPTGWVKSQLDKFGAREAAY